MWLSNLEVDPGKKTPTFQENVIGRVREGIFIFLTSQTSYSVSLCPLIYSINTALIKGKSESQQYGE